MIYIITTPKTVAHQSFDVLKLFSALVRQHVALKLAYFGFYPSLSVLSCFSFEMKDSVSLLLVLKDCLSAQHRPTMRSEMQIKSSLDAMVDVQLSQGLVLRGTYNLLSGSRLIPRHKFPKLLQRIEQIFAHEFRIEAPKGKKKFLYFISSEMFSYEVQ